MPLNHHAIFVHNRIFPLRAANNSATEGPMNLMPLLLTLTADMISIHQQVSHISPKEMHGCVGLCFADALLENELKDIL